MSTLPQPGAEVEPKPWQTGTHRMKTRLLRKALGLPGTVADQVGEAAALTPVTDQRGRWGDFSIVTDRLTAARPYTATRGHRVPSHLPAGSQDELLRQLGHVFAALGVRDGPFDCDFVATQDRVFLLEATPRLGGNSLSRLVQVCAGFYIVGAAIGYACGQSVCLPPTASVIPSAVLILGVSRSGSL